MSYYHSRKLSKIVKDEKKKKSVKLSQEELKET